MENRRYEPAEDSGQAQLHGRAFPAEYKKSIGSRYREKFQERSMAVWSAVTVMRILTYEAYTGVRVQGKTTTPNCLGKIPE